MDVADPATIVAAAWEERLGAAPSPQDNFFAAGGDSVDAARVVRRISTDLDVTLPIKALFEHPVFADLCDHLASVTPTTFGRAADVGGEETHGLTRAQRRLWLHHRAHPHSWTYHVPTVLTLRGPVLADFLADAVSDLVARHEPLRTTYDEGPDIRDGLPVPVAHIHPARQVDLDVRVVAGQAEAEAAVTEVIATPFDLSGAPPVRATLLRLGPEEHWLVLVVHHIATDGDAQRVLVEELAVRYNALARSEPVDLPALAVPFRRVTTASAVAATGLLSYVDRFVGATGAAPTTIGEPVAHGTTAQVVRRLGAAPAAAVRAVAAARGSTAYAVLLGVFAELLARQIDQDRVVIGFPESVRNTAHSEEIVGLLVDTRAVAIDTSGRPDVRTLTDRAAAEVLAARTSAVQIEQISDRLGLGGDVPLFRTWFNHLGQVAEAPAMQGLDVGFREPSHPPALFDLNIYLAERDDDVEISLVHDRAVVSSREAAELLDQYLELVRTAVGSPSRPVRDIGIGSSRSGVGSAAALDAASDPPRWDDQWAAVRSRSRGAEAVRGPDGGLTRADLEHLVEQLAGRLRRVGCGPGSTVAVEVVRSPAVLVAVLATWRLGAEVLVCDPQHPEPRRAAHVAAAGATIAIRGRGVSGSAPASEIRVDSSGAALPGAEATACPTGTDVAGHGPRYVAFTSGTTGRAVGVRSNLRPVEHFLGWYSREFGIGEHDRVSVLAGLSHDPLLREILLGVWTGAVTCVPAPDLLIDPEGLAAWLVQERVTVVHATPPLARLLVGTRSRAPEVRLLCLGGADLTGEDVESLRRWAPRATMLNGYGTTETPQLASYGVVRPGRPPDIGRGAPGSQLLVVDPVGRPCEVGRPGCIVVRSRHLAEPVDVGGTALVGMADDPVAGVRRFATGDRGLRLVDGDVRFLERDDGLTEVRGHRVHPAETDLALRTVAGVLDCVTLARATEDGHELLSYVAASDLTSVRIRQALARLLPAPSIPAHVVVLDRLPMTPNGKVDLGQLPKPPADGAAAVTAAAPGGAGGPLEHRLHRLISAVLGVDDFAPTDTFFDLGGSSLTMLRLHTTLRREIAPDLTVVDLYENPTVRGLVNHLRASGGRALTARGVSAARAGQRSRRTQARSGLRPDPAGGGRA